MSLVFWLKKNYEGHAFVGQGYAIILKVPTVKSNSCLAVKLKNIKLSYAEMVKVTAAVEMQDRLIGNGGDPNTDLIQVDIKKK